MLPVYEGILESQQMVVIVLVEFRVELSSQLASFSICPFSTGKTYQVQHRYFHHTLIEVRCAVLDDLDCDNLLGLEVLTLDDLTKCALAEHVQDQISVPKCVSISILVPNSSLSPPALYSLVARFLRSKYIIDI